MMSFRRLLVPALGLAAALSCSVDVVARTHGEREEARRQVAEALADRTVPERKAELFRQARSFDPVYASCEEGDRQESQGKFAEAAESFRACREGDQGLLAAHQAWAEALIRARGRSAYPEVLVHLRELVANQMGVTAGEIQPIEDLIADLEDLLSDDFFIEEPRVWSEEELLEILTRRVRGTSRYDGPRAALWLDFRPGDLSLGHTAEEQLRTVASTLKNGLMADAKIQIEGYADSAEADSEAARVQLAERRARAVMDFLIRQGVPAQRLRIKSMGDQHPIASNKTEEGRKANRRVELYNLDTKQPIYRDVRKP